MKRRGKCLTEAQWRALSEGERKMVLLLHRLEVEQQEEEFDDEVCVERRDFLAVAAKQMGGGELAKTHARALYQRLRDGGLVQDAWEEWCASWGDDEESRVKVCWLAGDAQPPEHLQLDWAEVQASRTRRAERWATRPLWSRADLDAQGVVPIGGPA